MEFSKSPPYWAGLRKHKAHAGAVWEGSTIEINKSPPYMVTPRRASPSPPPCGAVACGLVLIEALNPD